MEGRKASLLEQERPNLFTTSVANIGIVLAGASGEQILTLVTCRPFGALAPGGPLRLVVRAAAVQGPIAGASPAR